MEKKGVLLVFTLMLTIFLVFSAVSVNAEGNIETKNVLLKFSLNKGESITKSIVISSPTGGDARLSVEGIENGVFLSEESVVFDKGEERTIGVFFNSSSVSEGVYVGNIKISLEGDEKRIPVIFEVESKDVFFDGNLEIPSKYSDISPGSQITVQLNVFDLLSGGGTSDGLGSSSVDVEYSVRDLYGDVLVSEKENFVVDKKAIVSKSISFPKDVVEGQYVFSAVINYKSSIGTSTDLFTVSKKSSGSLLDFEGSISNLSLILIFIGFMFIVLILFFMYIIRDRDKLVLELKEYNTQELQRSKSLMREQERIVGKKEGIRKNAKKKKELQKEIKNKLEKIKKKNEERLKEFKKLREKGDVDAMKRKLGEWKKRGYHTEVMEYKLKGLTEGEMKNLLQKWKKKYGAGK
ncbi:hypothetical protein COU59_01550 [Candidatus Pacearchaeota archaeon CG10_big_fil_rev_8_21_14_0_10_34_12]|nr:MAG: hypothetical protein COU59_01550 [Candidatus Pacearchaeota archaeon CG10_big_fil_rev_8_21_14_0_10_34_12]